MKIKSAARAATLAKAHTDIQALAKAVRLKGVPPSNEGDRYGCCISVDAICDDGSCTKAYIEIDLATARKLLPHLQDVIGDELAALGVEQ